LQRKILFAKTLSLTKDIFSCQTECFSLEMIPLNTISDSEKCIEGRQTKQFTAGQSSPSAHLPSFSSAQNKFQPHFLKDQYSPISWYALYSAAGR
jgi:hypothetical protein